MRRRSSVDIATERAKARAIQRKENLLALGEYIEFGATNLVGIGSIIVGGIEILNPDFHPITLASPEAVLGFGLSLLVGPKIITKFSKVLNALHQ